VSLVRAWLIVDSVFSVLRESLSFFSIERYFAGGQYVITDVLLWTTLKAVEDDNWFTVQLFRWKYAGMRTVFILIRALKRSGATGACAAYVSL
jgi:hypothetical protein